ncbi:MAG: hypothetical protein JST82_10485 [Bacteroidetes bacterium]|nr:hypothetical protein [Bacteroidota bacterium]
MKLYPKQINSIEELRQEKQLLKQKVRDMEAEGVLKPPFLSSKNKPEDTGEEDASIFDFIGNNTLKNVLTTVGLPLLQVAGIKLEQKALKKLAIELLGGYAKWKAIALAYKGLQKILLSKKEKQDK